MGGILLMYLAISIFTKRTYAISAKVRIARDKQNAQHTLNVQLSVHSMFPPKNNLPLPYLAFSLSTAEK